MELADPKTKQVLIVDDDESFLNLLEILVRRDGFAIQLATDGERAMLKLARKPDALILDLMLPGGTSGFDVLKRLSESNEPVPPIIVVTAMGQSPEVQAVLKHPNVVQLLSKPINQNRLLKVLHKVLKTRPPATDPVSDEGSQA